MYKNRLFKKILRRLLICIYVADISNERIFD